MRSNTSAGSKDLLPEQKYVEQYKKYNKDCKADIGMRGCDSSQKHEGETQHYGRKILVDHVVRSRGCEIVIYFSKENSAGTGSTREHTKHHQKLLSAVGGEQFFSYEPVVYKGEHKATDAHCKQNDPVADKDIDADRRNPRNNH